MLALTIFPPQAWKVVRQFLRYVVVGGIAFGVDFSILVLLTRYLGIPYLLSAGVGFIVGVIVNYNLCLRWVFDARRLQDQRLELTLFTFIGLGGLVLNEVLLWLITEQLSQEYYVSKLLAAPIILVFNFGLRKILLFTQPSPGRQAS